MDSRAIAQIKEHVFLAVIVIVFVVLIFYGLHRQERETRGNRLKLEMEYCAIVNGTIMSDGRCVGPRGEMRVE